MEELLSRLGVNINVSFAFVFWSLIWIRVLAMSAMIPFLFGKPVPRVVMVAASVALSLFAFFSLRPAEPFPLPENVIFLIMLYLKEAFYGFIIGFSVGILFHAFQSVGQMIDNQRGVSIARVLIPQLGEQGSLSGLLLFQMAIVVYLAFGGHRLFLAGFFDSFISLPVFSFPEAGPGMFGLLDLMARMTGKIFYISLQLAAPVIIAILLADLILALANRIAPQINVWELGFNVKGYLGVLLLFVSITMIGKQIYRYGNEANLISRQAVQYLEGREAVQPPEEGPPEDGLPKPQEGPPQVITE